MKKVLVDTLNKNKQEYIEDLKGLIGIKTENIGHGVLGGYEKEGQVYLEKLAKKVGFDAQRQDMSEETILKSRKINKEGNIGHNYKDHDRYNLICEYSEKNPGKTIVFNGHIDTMPAGDLSKWTYDPYTGTEVDGKIYGLGTADMKSGLIAPFMAVKLIKESGLQLPGTVKVMSVCDEEGGGNGTVNAVMNGIKGDYCVVCECSEKNMIVAHMGFVGFDVDVKGVALHAGSKWKGVNAIEKAMLLIQDLKELEHNWLMNYKHPLLPAPTINLGVIQGGDAASTVAGKCTFKAMAHFLPTVMSYDQVVDDIFNTIKTRAEGDSWLRENMPEITISQSGFGFEIDTKSEFVTKTKDILEDTLDREVKIISSTAGNDARIMQNMAEIPTIILGPASINQCHSVDEYVEIDSYLESILMYASMILNLSK